MLNKILWIFFSLRVEVSMAQFTAESFKSDEQKKRKKEKGMEGGPSL